MSNTCGLTDYKMASGNPGYRATNAFVWACLGYISLKKNGFDKGSVRSTPCLLDEAMSNSPVADAR